MPLFTTLDRRRRARCSEPPDSRREPFFLEEQRPFA
jgi:hypothetical protein